MKILSIALVTIMFSSNVFAADAVKGSNYMVVDSQNWKTGNKSGYWMVSSRGVSEYAEGPFETSAVECHGAGFWDEGGSWGEGICVHGEGEDTRTSTWKTGKGETVGSWEMIGGTGKYEGITGEGTYKPSRLPGGRAVSRFEGNVTLVE